MKQEPFYIEPAYYVDDKWNKSYLEYCEIMQIHPNVRDQILFMAGYTFHSIESSTEYRRQL